MNRKLPLLLLLVFLPACSKGGEKTTSPIKVALNFTFFGMGGKAAITEFPVPLKFGLHDSGTLRFTDSGEYTVKRPGKPSSRAFPYKLQADGFLELSVSSLSRWPGAMDLQNKSVLFFVDRRRRTRNVGDNAPYFYLGVPQIQGTPKLESTWNAFGDEMVFASKGAKGVPENVARGFSGDLVIDKTGAITKGSWVDSTGSKGGLVLVSGKTRSFANGELDATLDLKGGSQTGVRSYSGQAGKHLIVLLDEDASKDQTIGMLILVRQRATVDIKTLAGTWLVGAHTLFTQPKASGVDAANGELTLGSNGTWTLRVTGIRGAPFEYKGTFKAGANGKLLFKEDNQARDWVAALDPDGRFLVLSDNIAPANVRSKDSEVGLYFAIRKTLPKKQP
ncbi:MAG TPA: hypothetical protein ENK02_00900 [Planctomycetes bacterium]|nr:hypothetical protein [Planctomycetota bacterium]